jgi:hypothetical protein
MKHNLTNSLGCGKEFAMNTNNGFICGIANAWGEERLCQECKAKLRKKWDDEDSKKMKGGNN